MEICWVREYGIEAVAEDAAREVAAGDDGIVWVHLDHTDERGLALLNELIPAKPHDLQECHTRSPLPNSTPTPTTISPP